jgi:hypothetical protein
MRQVFQAQDTAARDDLHRTVHTAEDAYLQARSLIGHLEMRPHASEELLKLARAAADTMLEAIQRVRWTLIASHAPELPVGAVIELIKQGYARTQEYEKQARSVIGELLATRPQPPAPW